MLPSSPACLPAEPGRCGTTWVCQFVPALRSRGDMDFEEINLVGPICSLTPGTAGLLMRCTAAGLQPTEGLPS